MSLTSHQPTRMGRASIASLRGVIRRTTPVRIACLAAAVGAMFALVSVAEAGGKDASAVVRVPVPASRASAAQLELNRRLAHDTHLGPLAWGRSGPYVADHVLVGFRLGLGGWAGGV